MDRFKKIVLPYNASTADKIALQRAATLAEKNKAKVQAIHVSEPVPATAKLLLGKERADTYASDHRINVEAILDRHITELGLAKIPLTFLSGDPAIETIRFILKNKCDILMKVRDSPSERRVISINDMKLLRKCPVPVMLLKPGRKKKLSRLMAAIDLTPDSSSREALRNNILKLAISLSEREDAALDIVHAWQTFSMTTLQGPRFRMSTHEVRAIAEKETQLRKQWLKEALAPFENTNVNFKTHLLEGEPAETIHGFAVRRRTDLLVMGSLARGGLQGLLIGNTAERVLDRMTCSTLTVKPDDFICPVKA